MDRRLHTRFVLGIFVLVLVGAACGSKGSDTASAGAGGGNSADASAGNAGGEGSGGGGYGSSRYGGGGGDDSQTTASGGKSARTVEQADFRFSPSRFSMKGGQTITVDNTTSDTPHTFTVKGQSIDVTVDPGSSSGIEIDLPAGAYSFYCRFHQSSGMTGKLTVT